MGAVDIELPALLCQNTHCMQRVWAFAGLVLTVAAIALLSLGRGVLIPWSPLTVTPPLPPPLPHPPPPLQLQHQKQLGTVVMSTVHGSTFVLTASSAVETLREAHARIVQLKLDLHFKRNGNFRYPAVAPVRELVSNVAQRLSQLTRVARSTRPRNNTAGDQSALQQLKEALQVVAKLLELLSSDGMYSNPTRPKRLTHETLSELRQRVRDTLEKIMHAMGMSLPPPSPPKFQCPTPTSVAPPSSMPLAPAPGTDQLRLALVMTVSRAERTGLLMKYEHWFTFVHLILAVGPAHDICEATLKKSKVERTFCDCAPGPWELAQKNSTLVASTMLRASRRLLPDGRSSLGVVFAHFDMWLNVRVLDQLPTYAVWALKGGLYRHARCAPRDDIFWRANGGFGSVGKYLASSHPNGGACPDVPLPELTVAAEAHMAARNAAITPKPIIVGAQRLRTCCYGWTDLFYVPSGALLAFARLSAALSSLHQEVAIPTALHTLHERARVDKKQIACHGGCCKTWNLQHTKSTHCKMWPMGNASICGHRLDFTAEQVQSLLHRTVDPDCRTETRRQANSDRCDLLPKKCRRTLTDQEFWEAHRTSQQWGRNFGLLDGPL